MLSQFCIRRPIFATVLSIIIVLAGLLCLRVLPLSQYPDISPPSVMISTTYEGADSQTIARTVAAPIEDQLSGIEGLLYYTSSIRSNGDIRIQCVFDVGTDANDAMLEINNRVRTAERRLPDRVRDEGVSVRKRNNDTLLMMALWSPDGSYGVTDLADYANLNIVDELKRIPGIGDVNVFGNAQSAMRIWLDPDRMGALGVTVQDVDNAIQTQNAQRTAGRVGVAPTIPEQQLFYTVRTPGQLLTPEQFANVIVRADGPNGIVRMRDIAATEVGKRSYEFRVDINGLPGVNVGVYLQTGRRRSPNSPHTTRRARSHTLSPTTRRSSSRRRSPRSTAPSPKRACSSFSSSSFFCRAGARPSFRSSPCRCRSSARWRGSGSWTSRSTRSRSLP